MAKVERKEVEPKFVPVVLMLESQAEVDYVTVMLGKGKNSISRACGLGDSSDIYEQLLEFASDSRPRVIGDLNV